MIVIVQTNDHSIQATEVAEALEFSDFHPERVVVREVQPSDTIIDEWWKT